MPEFRVKEASPAQIKEIAGWLIDDRASDPMFRHVNRTGLHRWLYRRFVAPRYLRTMANTWVLEQDGQMAGYAVAEQRGIAIHVADIAVRPGFDRPGLVEAVLERAEALASGVEYRFIRTAPADTSEVGLQPYRAAGFQMLDYYLWAYTGEVRGGETPAGTTLQPLAPTRALARRRHYLALELDASDVAGRELIDDTFLPNRPPRQRAFEVEHDGAGVGYLSPRPNERGDDVLTLIFSLLPELWGSELEAAIVAGFVGEFGKGEPLALRLLLSTSAHCEQAEARLNALGLRRELDVRPVLFKALPAATE